jgi:hypothetical protein
MAVHGDVTEPTGGADAYPVGFCALFRFQVPATGFITKIGGWAKTEAVPSTEAFRFFVDEGDATNVETGSANRRYLSPSNIPLTTAQSVAGDYLETLASPLAVTEDEWLWIGMAAMATNEVRFMYETLTGGRIIDYAYGGGSAPPSDPLNSGDVNYYDDYRYGIWFEYETDAGQTVTVALVDNTQTFHAGTVTPGAVSVSAPLLDNNQTFHAGTVTPGQVSLAAPLVQNDQTFHNGTVTPGTATLTAPLTDNNQTFHAGTVTPGAVTLTAPLVQNDQTFHAGTVASIVNLTAPLVQNDQTFHAGVVTPGAVTVTAPLVQNDQTFHSGTVTPGAVTITAPLVQNDQTFHNGTVVASGLILVPLVDNQQVFHAGTVTPGAVTIEAPLVQNDQTFHSGVVGSIINLTAPLVDNQQTFHNGVVTPGAVTITAPLLDNAQTFHAGIVTPGQVILGAPLVDNQQTFHSGTVTLPGVILGAPLVDNQQVFHTGIVTPGPVTISAPLVDNTQTFFSGIVYRDTADMARDEILSLFYSYWTAQTPVIHGSVINVLWDGLDAQTPPPVDTPYARVTCRHTRSRQTTFAEAGQRRFTRYGLISVQVFAPLLTGDGLSFSEKEAIIARDAFEGKSTAMGIWFRNARIVDIGPSGPFYQSNVLVEFEYDEFH